MPTFETPEPILADIDLDFATVRINAGERTDTVVEVRPTDPNSDGDVRAAEQVHVEYSAAEGRLGVRAPKSRSRWWLGLLLRPGSIEVTIDLPAGSRIEAHASADFRCRGRLGDSRFRSSYGDISLERVGMLQVSSTAGEVRVRHAAGPAEISASHGEIRLGEIGGPAVIKSSSGGISIGDAAGDVRMNTSYGDITVGRALANVHAKTAYGRVRIDEMVRGSALLETSYGRIDVGIAEGTAAWLDISSVSGTVTSDLAASDGPASADETAEVRARSGYGDVLVRRSTEGR